MPNSTTGWILQKYPNKKSEFHLKENATNPAFIQSKRPRKQKHPAATDERSLPARGTRWKGPRAKSRTESERRRKRIGVNYTPSAAAPLPGSPVCKINRKSRSHFLDLSRAARFVLIREYSRRHFSIRDYAFCDPWYMENENAEF